MSIVDKGRAQPSASTGTASSPCFPLVYCGILLLVQFDLAYNKFPLATLALSPRSRCDSFDVLGTVHAAEAGTGPDRLQADGRRWRSNWHPRPRTGPRGQPRASNLLLVFSFPARFHLMRLFEGNRFRGRAVLLVLWDSEMSTKTDKTCLSRVWMLPSTLYPLTLWREQWGSSTCGSL